MLQLPTSFSVHLVGLARIAAQTTAKRVVPINRDEQSESRYAARGLCGLLQGFENEGGQERMSEVQAWTEARWQQLTDVARDSIPFRSVRSSHLSLGMIHHNEYNPRSRKACRNPGSCLQRNTISRPTRPKRDGRTLVVGVEHRNTLQDILLYTPHTTHQRRGKSEGKRRQTLKIGIACAKRATPAPIPPAQRRMEGW